MAMRTVDASGQTKVVNWPGAQLSKTCYYRISTTLLSLPARIALPKMGLWRSTMTNFLSIHSPFYTAPVYLLKFGLQPYFTWYTSTIV
jgi:hypothetical protein